MKKGIYLLITLIVSLFVFSGRVDAAKELTCVYKNKVAASNYTTMLVQKSDGTKYYYVRKVKTDDINDINYVGWKNYKEYTDMDLIFDFYTEKIDADNNFTACPPYVSSFGKSTAIAFFDKETQKFNAYAHKSSLSKDLSCENCLPNFVSGKKDEEKNNTINNTKWIAKCAYSDVEDKNKDLFYIYFNDSTMLVDNISRGYASKINLGFSASELYKYYINYSSCPYNLYELSILNYELNLNSEQYEKQFDAYPVTYYLDKPNVTGVSCSGADKSQYPQCSELVTIKLNTSKSDYFGKTPSYEEPPLDIDDCKDLFGPDLVKKINDVMDWIKIAVPILLIAFGIVDFTKAVFAGSEDDMSKFKKTFFRRIIAAVLVFLAPIFVNLILTLANEVWEYISPDACIGQIENS